jgi:hypothetical protein
MRNVMAGQREPRRSVPAAAPVVLLTGLALWIRLAALPGAWGADSVTYFEACRSGESATMDPRSDRWLVLALVRGALRLGDWSPAAASLPGVVMSAAVVPVLWLALRRRVGDSLALLPCALWAFLGLDVERVVGISSDAMLALPAAFAVWGLVAARRRHERPFVPLVLAGVACGVGATLKETFVLATIGFAGGAFCIGRGRARWTNAAALAVPAAVLFGAALLVEPHRVSNASQYMVMDKEFVPAGGAAFVRRIAIEAPQILLTATQAFGLLLVVSIPLLVRLPFRALRGDPLATSTLVGLLAFDLAPVSLQGWSLLPANRPRYLLCLMPALFAALVDALRDRVESKSERWISLGAAALAMRFAGASTWAMLLVAPGLVLTAWPALPAPVASILTERTRVGVAAGVLLASTVAWTGLARSPSTVEWIAFAVVGVLATTPWLVGRDRGSPAPYLAAGCAVVLALTMARSRFAPDDGWTAWTRLPPTGRVYAEHLVGRRLRAAAVSAGADPSRVVLLESDGDRPRNLADDDRIVARDEGPLGGGLRLADACRLPGSGVRETSAKLGELVIFEPAQR